MMCGLTGGCLRLRAMAVPLFLFLFLFCGVGPASGASPSAPPYDTLMGDLRTRDRLVHLFAAYLSPPDRDGDGLITDADVLLDLLDPFTFTNQFDMDGDGDVDASDDDLALRRILAAMLGDRTGDGRVDGADVQAASRGEVADEAVVARARQGGPPVEFALATSEDWGPWLPAHSVADVARVVEAMGNESDESDEPNEPDAIVEEVMLLRAWVIDAVRVGDPAGVVLGAEEYPHHQFFSDQYPGRRAPAHYPPNHSISLTRQWGLHREAFSSTGPRHNMYASNRNWPANHHNDISYGWERGRGDHNAWDSRLNWPPFHLVAPSAGWPAWDEQPVHETAVSRGWPPAHVLENSVSSEHREAWSAAFPDESFPTWVPSDHAAIISQSHPGAHDGSTSEHRPGSHGAALSGHGWPPNHGGSVSVGWTPGQHTYGLSSGWPPNHHGPVSNGWPTDGWPGWPANHQPEWSAGATPPSTPLPPLFPPDHSLFQTAQDIEESLSP